MAKSKSVWEQNFAKKADIRERVKEAFQGRMKLVRDDRRRIELDWLEFFNMWAVKHDDHHNYSGRAKLYIPEVRKNVESQARQLVAAAFPNDDFFDVSPGLTGTKKGARIWKSIMRYHLEHSDIRVQYHVFQRLNCLYGTSPGLVRWNKHEERVFKSMRNPKTGVIKPTRRMVELRNGPQFLARDTFKFFPFNPNAADLDDGCFEDSVLGYFDVLRMSKNKELWGLNDVLDAANTNAYQMQELEADLRRMEELKLPINNQGYAGEVDLSKNGEGDAETRRKFLLTTIFTKAVLPEACEPDEDPELPIPVQIQMIGNEHVTLVRRNPFFHQRPPYVIGRYIWPNPDQFYGEGIPHAIRYMQHEMNSKAEQGMDSATLALNPISFIDPSLASMIADFNVEPGAKWFISPQGVKFGAIPDLTQTAYNAIGQLRSQVADFSDRSPNLPSQLMGKSRSATQSQIVENSLSVDQTSFQIQMEKTVLQPALEQFEYLIDQNQPEDQTIMILGARASDWFRMQVKKQTTLGNYMYYWKVASQLVSKPIMARQMIDLFKIIMMLPAEAQSQLSFRWAEAVKTLYTELWGMPDADKIMGMPEDMVSQDPSVEHKMLDEGFDIEVLPGDDDALHIKDHDEQVKVYQKAGKKELADELTQHVLIHTKQAQQKQEQIKQIQAQMMMQAQAQAAAYGHLNPGQQPGRGKPGSGNRTQMSPNATGGDQGSGVRP
jgi:hypothetical protein